MGRPLRRIDHNSYGGPTLVEITARCIQTE